MAKKKEAAPEEPQIHIEHCNFAAVQWSEPAIAVLHDLIEATIANAEATKVNAEVLLEAAKVMRASNVTVETMLHFGGA